MRVSVSFVLDRHINLLLPFHAYRLGSVVIEDARCGSFGPVLISHLSLISTNANT